ncbi:MAG TPA: transglutaminase domain-containing protein [Thermoflexia bacterium]|nr:transglutaminase domain-containing protein [Thermoflexia bacterium]
MTGRLPLWQKLWRFLVKKIGIQYLLTYYLLLAAFFVAAQGVSAVVRAIDFAPLWYLSVLALLAGWITASGTWRGWRSALANFLAGVMFSSIRAGRLEQEIWAVWGALPPLIYECMRYLWRLANQYGRQLLIQLQAFLSLQEGGVLQELRPPPAPALQPLWRALNTLGTDIGVLATRSWIWLVALLRDESLFDPVVSRLLWGLLFWLLAAWAAWQIRRHRKPLLASAPLGILLSVTLAYVWGETFMLVLLMGITLLLIAVVNHDRRECSWDTERMDYSRAVRSDLIWTAALVAAGLMLLAFIVPVISLEGLTEFVEKFRIERQREDVGLSLGLEQQPRPAPPTTLERARSGGLPRSHLIGTGPELSKEIVMLVSTGELPPQREGGLMADPPRHYWRSATYEVYTGRGWQVYQTETRAYAASEPARAETLIAHRPLRQEVRLVGEAGELLYVAGTLVAVNQSYQLAWRTYEDPFAARLMEETASYRADSLIPTAGAAELRATGSDYPAWIQERYLALPENIPERVTELAHDLTATRLTPYDRAVAIEEYLRATYPYTLEVPPPPITLDIADYFLFELQKGYCDYYATAMVVLARSAGLPARLAIGYAPGRYLAERAQYIVTEADAHAWVEVYFPNYGWINFEPTAGRPPLERYADGEMESLPPAGEEPPAQPLEPTSPRLPFPLGRWLLAFSVGLFAVALWSELDLLWLRLGAPRRASETLYRRLRRWARRLDVELQPGDTPYEFAAALEARVTLWAERYPLAEWERAALPEISELVEDYVRLHYHPSPELVASESGVVWRSWRVLRWRLWLLWLWEHLPRLRVLKRVAQQLG